MPPLPTERARTAATDPPGFKLRLFGYSMYDFANSAFATTILAVLYNQYYAREVAADVTLFGRPVPGAEIGLVSCLGTVNYDRGLCTGAAILRRGG